MYTLPPVILGGMLDIPTLFTHHYSKVAHLSYMKGRPFIPIQVLGSKLSQNIK